MSDKHSTAPVRAVAYYRMSSDRQETSIADQRSAVEALARRAGYGLAGEYLDEGISGNDTERRAGFRRMTRDGAAGLFDVVLCWDQDRFGRFDPIEGGYWIKPLRDAGVRLETVAQGKIDWNDFGGRLLWTVTQEGKYAFLRDLSRNTLRGMVRVASAGDWLGGTPPYGYDAVEKPGRPPGARRWPKALVPGDPRKVEVVRWLFRTYAEKDVSIRWLGEELYRRGVPSPRGSRLWVPNTLRGILTKREYAGDVDWGRLPQSIYHRVEGGEPRPFDGRRTRPRRAPKYRPDDFVIVKDAHEPLIDRATWEAVQARLAGNRKRTSPGGVERTWLLSGLLVCGRCGSRMVGSSNSVPAIERQGPAYVCNGYHAHGLKVCHRHGIAERPLLACLVRKIQEDFLDPANLDALRAELRRKAGEADGAAAARARQLRARVEELGRNVETGNRNMALAPPDAVAGIALAVREWREERGRLEVELARLESGADREEMEETLAAAEAKLWHLREVLADADPAGVRAVLWEMVARVELHYGCAEPGLRQRCAFARGVIHLRPDARVSRPDGVFRLEPCATARLWL